ncbi:MAG: hypothetical protein V7K69_11485 [Nostoc sp.]|uniref:hypothetical protein n=1 Tax=Nostoc sp. TaxID=1180 RepID=UPI002FFB82F2
MFKITNLVTKILSLSRYEKIITNISKLKIFAIAYSRGSARSLCDGYLQIRLLHSASRTLR